MEKVILVGIYGKDRDKKDAEVSLDELANLCKTDFAVTVAKVLQKRERPDAAYFIGYGKALEIKELVGKYKADAVVFDEILKPVQQRNLDESIGVKVIDRVRVILDIFAFRARTKEGKLQVERAELSYHYSHLTNQGIHLDSQTGGIGTRRGPGEKKLETDKRHIRDKIAELDREIEKIKERREVQRSARSGSDLPEVAIAGYTNAGKSTLLKTLSKSAVYADDKLFATLDPLTRKVRLPGGRFVLLTDTVGFINKLPHDLVDAFKSTMEEILRAKCVLHVIDASVSNAERQKQIDTVNAVLKDIGADAITEIKVFNKADKLDKFEKAILNTPDACVISAVTGEGLDRLLSMLEKTVMPKHSLHVLRLDYEKQNAVNKIHQLANVKDEKYLKSKIVLTVETSDENWSKIEALTKA